LSSQEEASQLDHDHVGTGHLLLGLTGQRDSVAVQILAALGVDLEAFHARVIRETDSSPEGLEYSPPPRVWMRPGQTVMSDPVQALLDSIDDRLSAIERHLGMASGGPENVIPPS
jgi:ATP-dependent Clp protease ATP-binding subunit ClpA